jgi:hypothetical protein
MGMEKGTEWKRGRGQYGGGNGPRPLFFSFSSLNGGKAAYKVEKTESGKVTLITAAQGERLPFGLSKVDEKKIEGITKETIANPIEEKYRKP